MKKIPYELTPGAYGSTRIFIDKTGTIGELIFDTGMLLRLPFNKTIPNLETINTLFMEGFYLRASEWKPFEINMFECNEVVNYLINLPLNRPFRVE